MYNHVEWEDQHRRNVPEISVVRGFFRSLGRLLGLGLRVLLGLGLRALLGLGLRALLGLGLRALLGFGCRE